ncbi:hypothetical protein GJ496_002572 [Pomphorhynchus laevis]|nr:hypothetical protein GJ496_002572 [Pomphorhynchus laevis]
MSSRRQTRDLNSTPYIDPLEVCNSSIDQFMRNEESIHRDTRAVIGGSITGQQLRDAGLEWEIGLIQQYTNQLDSLALTNQFRHNNYQPPQSYAPPQNTQLPIPNFNSPTENLPICINNPQIFPPQQFTVPIIQPNQQCNTYSLPMMPFPPLINPLLSQTIPPFYNILQDSIHLPHNHQTLRRSVNSNG